MSHASWDGSIQFGLVHIGVALYPMVKPRNINLHLLDKRDFAPIGYTRVNKNTGEEVDWDHIVRGYEYQKNQFVVLSDEELKRAHPEETKTFQVDGFVFCRTIPFVYYQTPYWVVPDKKSERSFELFRLILQDTKRVAVGKFVMRTQEQVAALMPFGTGLVLEELRYASELRTDLPEVNLHVKLTQQERGLAKKLIDEVGGKWIPEKIPDRYHQDLERIIDEKVAAGRIHELDDTPVDYEPPISSDKELMSLLKKSLGVNSTQVRSTKKSSRKKVRRSKGR